MQIINLRRYYYPLVKEDTFVEVSDEVADLLLEMKREEDRIIRKISYHKAYYSLDCNDFIEYHAFGWAQPSPEDIFMEKEDETHHELMLRRLEDSVDILTPTQERRLRARYMDKKKFREIAADDGVSPPPVTKSVLTATAKLRKHFDKNNWKLWED